MDLFCALFFMQILTSTHTHIHTQIHIVQTFGNDHHSRMYMQTHIHRNAKGPIAATATAVATVNMLFIAVDDKHIKF